MDTPVTPIEQARKDDEDPNQMGLVEALRLHAAQLKVQLARIQLAQAEEYHDRLAAPAIAKYSLTSADVIDFETGRIVRGQR